MFSAKLLPLVLFLWGKMCKLADAECEHWKILLPLTFLGEWGVTGPTPFAPLACWKSWVLPCVKDMGIHPNPACLIVWQVHCSSRWRLCGAKLPKERSGSKWKFCSTGTWEVSTHCFYFFGALQSLDRESERDSGSLHSIKFLCSLETQASRVVFIEC